MSDEVKTASDQAGQAAADQPQPEKKHYNLAGVPPAAERPGITPDQMYVVAKEFAARIFNNPSVGPKLQASGMILRMEYYDQENWGEIEPEVTIDCTKDPVELTTGPCGIEPKVIMRMHADIAHRFWMQRISMMVAIARRQMIAKGPIAQIMRLLPIIKPSYVIYKEVLTDLGMNELLAYPAGKGEAEEEATAKGADAAQPEQQT